VTSYPQRVKERDAGLGQMKPEDRVNTERALAEESKAVKTQYDADKKAGLKWLTPDQWDKPALDETLRYLDQEMKRFDNLKIETQFNSGKAWRDAWSAIQNRDQQATTDALKAARTSKMPARYLTRLEDAAKAAGLKP
jgi:ABC-type cobalamin/Fe3+-siderophores transport system ATPase subunit